MQLSDRFTKIRKLAKTAREYSLPRGKTFDVHMFLLRIERLAEIPNGPGTSRDLPIPM